MANPQLEEFLKAAEARSAAKAAAPVATKAATAVPASAPVKLVEEAVKRSTPSAEPVTVPPADVKKAEKLRADLFEELPLEDFYKKAGRFIVTDDALRALEDRVPRTRFKELAGVQGIDLEDMAAKARTGMPFEQYRASKSGVVGFKPRTEREADFSRVADDYASAEKGEAPTRPLDIETAKETTTKIPWLGEGYEIGGTTPDELLETTKPGEHQYAIAQQFIDSFEKAKPEVVHLTDMYSTNAGAGNTQRWIQRYIDMESRNRGIRPDMPNADAEMAKLRRDALYYILAKKTVGQWTPGVFVKDVQITDPGLAKPLGTGEGVGAAARDIFAALSPNVEIVGFNSKGQAVVRQESPAGTALRALDAVGVVPFVKTKVPIPIPGQAAIAGLLGKEENEGYLEAALRGVQTNAFFVDSALEAAKGSSPGVQAAAGLAAMVPTVLYPDLTGAAEKTFEAGKAIRKTFQDKRLAREAVPILDDIIAAYKAKEFEKASKLDNTLRNLSKNNHGVMQSLMSLDALMAEKLEALNPTLAHLNPTLVDELITVGATHSPELSDIIYKEAGSGFPHLHFSRQAKELAQHTEEGGVGATLAAYVNAGNFDRHFQRIERARAAFLKEVPPTAEKAIQNVLDGTVKHLREKSIAAARLGSPESVADAARYRKLADLVAAHGKELIDNPKSWLAESGPLRTAMRADPELGGDAGKNVRKWFYTDEGSKAARRVEALKTVDYDTLYKQDLEVFDRAREAVETNIKSRMMAAELLKRELGAGAKINIMPAEILDDLMAPGTERLSPRATAMYLSTVKKLPTEQDRKAWLGAFQLLDEMFRGAANLKNGSADDYWRDIQVLVGKDMKPKFVRRAGGEAVAKAEDVAAGFERIADADIAAKRLRDALEGVDPSYRLKSLTYADGTQIGGEVAVGDVSVRATRTPGEPDAPYRVEVFVGERRSAAFVSKAALKDAIAEGIDEAEKAIRLRVTEGGPAINNVVIPPTPKTAATRAAEAVTEAPAETKAEEAAVDTAAKTAPAPKLHPDTESVLASLDPALKADPDAVSRTLAALDKLKPGSKLPPPPKGVNKVLMGAIREELVKSGKLAKLDDGSIVKAGTVAEEARAAAAAPVAERAAGALTPEAEQLVASVESGGVPTIPFATSERMQRIARENGISEDQIDRFIAMSDQGEAVASFVRLLQRKAARAAAPAVVEEAAAAPAAAEVAAPAAAETVAEAPKAALPADIEELRDTAAKLDVARRFEEANGRPMTDEDLAAMADDLRDMKSLAPVPEKLGAVATEEAKAAFKPMFEPEAPAAPAVAEVKPPTAVKGRRAKAAVFQQAPEAPAQVVEAQKAEPVAEAPEPVRAVEEAPAAVPEVAKAEEVAAPAQPTGIMQVGEAPAVSEEIVAPPAAPPAKVEPTVDELQATIERLEPLLDAKIKRTDVSKTGFTVELAGQQIRVEKRGDNWFNAATGGNLGDNATEATETLRTRLVLKPYTAAKDALERLGKAQVQAATLSSLDDALASVKKIRTSKDATKFFDVVDLLPLDEAERLDVLVKFKDKLTDLAAKAKTAVAADKFDDLITAVDDAVKKLRPAAAEAPSAVAAAQDALTETQRHAQAIQRMRDLTHRVQVTTPIGDVVVFGTQQGESFSPLFWLRAQPNMNIGEELYDLARSSPEALEGTRRQAAEMLAGQTVSPREFPANKYANAADMAFGSDGRVYPSLRRTAVDEGIDQAVKQRQVDAMIARLYGQAPAVEWEEVPKQFRVAAGSRLNAAEAGLASGELTQLEYNRVVSGVTADLNRQSELAKARQAVAQRRRGADWVRSRLLQYKDAGVIDEAGAEMADWFIRQNPNLANDLGVSAVKGEPLSGMAGEYLPGSRIVQLVKESGDEATVVHEILHHTERMLPEDLQAAVTSEWRKRVGNELKTATTPEQKAFLQNVLTQEAPAKALTDIVEGRVPAAYYQYMNPSEFWAVNASNIVAGRYAAFNAGMVKKAQQWLTEFIQKVKSVFGLQSDAPIIQGLEAVMKGDGTFVSNRMLADVETFRQVRFRPTDEGGEMVITGRFTPGGGKGLAGTQSIIELAAKTADPTTLLHEGAHYIRKSILDTQDMDNVVAWLNSMGVNVRHEFGEFVGMADAVAMAEEKFAVAFEKYVVTGKAPTPPLQRVFDTIKQAFVGAYRWMKTDAAKALYGEEPLAPQIQSVFDRYFTASAAKPVESTFDVIVREVKGAKATDARGALDVLAEEATRKGIPASSRDELVNRIASLKLPKDAPGDTVLLEFPAPVLGERRWTKNDILALQGEVRARRNEINLTPLRQALFGDPEEQKATEAIFAALEAREEGATMTTVRAAARTMAKFVLGGDVVSERGTRALPEILRRDLDTPARIIEYTIGDAVSVMMQTIRTNDPEFMYRFLGGETLTFASGRRVMTSGNEHIDGFIELYRNQYAAMTREEQITLQKWARILNTHPNPENLTDAQTISEALARAAMPESVLDVKDFEALKVKYRAEANNMIGTLEKFIELGRSGEGTIGTQLRRAMRDAAQEGKHIAFNEYRFAETLLYLSGSTERRGRLFVPVDRTFTKDQLVEQAKILLTDAQRIYGTDEDQSFARRLSVLVAAYGSSKRAKAELAALGDVLTEEQAHAFKQWTLAYNITPEMSAQLEMVKGKFGLNAAFVNETILGTDVYIPAVARQRMVDALARAQFSNTKLTKLGDLYQMAWTYMKKRMTRGAFVTKQRYFFINTIDHFNQMYLVVGFGPAAASFARLLLQGIPVSPLGQISETLVRIGAKAGFNDKAAIERFRDVLSRGGEAMAHRIEQFFGVAKYRVEINDILEGSEKLIILGGNVHTAKQLKDTFIAEGIFSSFDTRRLSEGVRMEGNIFGSELRKLAEAPGTSGPVANAAAKITDVLQDLSVDVVDDLADAWAERERVGAAVTLIETGLDPRAACRLTTDALYDYSQSMTKADRHFLLGSVLPFWAFQKNANQQFVNVLFSPHGAYRMMAMQRARKGFTTLATEVYYNVVGGELGLDVNNMPQDMQSLYYAIMTRAHEIYGDRLPPDVRTGLRLALTGRTHEVVNGKYYELDAKLLDMIRHGGLVPGGKFGGVGMADYMLAAPNKSGLPSYVRDRFGMVAPQRRNALVRHYGALMGGENDDYFYFMLPESSVESAYKHVATLMGSGLLMVGAFSPKAGGVPGAEIMAGGAESISLGDVGRALQPVLDLERSPVVGLGISMYAERGYPQRLHPVIAQALQRMTNVPVLRVPAKMDPFMGGTLPDTDVGFKAKMQLAGDPSQLGIAGAVDENGEPVDIVSILGEDYVRQIQELNSKDIPRDLTEVAKEERFYLPPGFMSLSFENSPLGEANKEMLKWEKTHKEGADPAGEAAYLTRILFGTDVVQVSPSRTAQQEEPVRYVESREPI